ncbi:inorganic triphosphatase [Skermanella aerolata]|uniref:Inorganic triphosphatase n=1 Tax=Skermanella aerolata TaxID=393310 RepID=A0A512DI28_9PROT|nr:CYTH and CHAD domain-containing protein [Skermanella aerolata]KJB97616.1 metal-chelation protein CHAD [Skermanella aerolata KACC 11604]GEO36128.1 inorganic triphosphatase [Skermanella aerolata]
MANQEIELKLRIDPEHLARFRNASAFADSTKRATTQSLESIYYDTEDFVLRQRGVTLRVRKKGKSFIQTLKIANEHAGGVFSRGEWECEVAGALPDLSAIDDAEALEHLGVVSADDLKPIFASHIKRSVRLLNGADGQPGDTAIEVAVDQGEIRASDGTVLPIAEVELELKSGAPQALFDLALKLTEVAPVRVETRTKAERGYALVAGEAQSAVKARKLELTPEHTAEQALASIMRNCLSHAVLNEAAALKGEDAEGIHQMRVALRRLRSALGLFRDLMPADQYDFLSGEVKWLAGELGHARNWDVFLADLLAPVEEALGGDEPTKALHCTALASRTRAYEQAHAAILSPRYTVLLLRLGGWLESRSWRQQPLSEEAARLFAPVRELSDGLLAKRHRKARKRGAGFADLAPAERHQLRIALKKLRYAAEFFRSLYGDKEVARYLKRLSALQDDLGHLNDVATAEMLMGRLAGESAEGEGLWRIGGGMVIGWHARGVTQLEPCLVRDWHKFAKATPFWSKPSNR